MKQNAVVKLLKPGFVRVLDGETGMTFIVDRFTEAHDGLNAQVRDYRFPSGDRPFQIWTLGPNDL